MACTLLELNIWCCTNHIYIYTTQLLFTCGLGGDLAVGSTPLLISCVIGVMTMPLIIHSSMVHAYIMYSCYWGALSNLVEPIIGLYIKCMTYVTSSAYMARPSRQLNIWCCISHIYIYTTQILFTFGLSTCSSVSTGSSPSELLDADS